ncbi:hypothetical protein DPMN_183438 [Dreissena polymorpha]|uniref:Uncharacterized protein n=1 Tax=Dreissena polymorpha TaxID=45954 RepID=A0A9D4DGL8_DREPO|nr:hypothetical protein DPMN_183438 [Dreissena polymorpha]
MGLLTFMISWGNTSERASEKHNVTEDKGDREGASVMHAAYMAGFNMHAKGVRQVLTTFAVHVCVGDTSQRLFVHGCPKEHNSYAAPDTNNGTTSQRRASEIMFRGYTI